MTKKRIAVAEPQFDSILMKPIPLGPEPSSVEHWNSCVEALCAAIGRQPADLSPEAMRAVLDLAALTLPAFQLPPKINPSHRPPGICLVGHVKLVECISRHKVRGRGWKEAVVREMHDDQYFSSRKTKKSTLRSYIAQTESAYVDFALERATEFQKRVVYEVRPFLLER